LAAPGQFRVVRARTLAEARQFLQARAYSAVLTDLGLPDSVGLETLISLLAVSPDTPMLVLSGADDESLATGAVRAGAQENVVF
jgi:DNA-binding NarL/FixJ family response regulator